MPSLPFAPPTVLDHVLSAAAVHVAPEHVLDGLDWHHAGIIPLDAPHSIFQITNHAIYWQDLFLRGLSCSDMQGPVQAQDGWPGPQAPPDEATWHTTVRQYKQGLLQAKEAAQAQDPLQSIPATTQTSRFEVLTTLALHNSYHAGQIVLLRRILGAWPPPSGGHTW